MWIEAHQSGKINFLERYKDPYTGKWRRVSTLMEKDTPRIRKQAQKILDEKIAAILGKKNITEVTFDDVYKEWFSYYQVRVKRTSWIKVKPMMKHIREIIPDDALVSKIDSALINKLIDTLYTFGKHSLNYTKQIRTTLSMILDFAVEKNYISTNPVRQTKITPKKVEEDKRRKHISEKYLEQDEAASIIDWLYGNKRRLIHARISDFLYLTGLRYGELQALQLRNYTGYSVIVDGTLDYTLKSMAEAQKTTPKNAPSEREVELPDRAIKIIEELILENKTNIPDYNDSSYIFISSYKRQTPLTIHAYNDMLHRVEEELSFKKILTSHIFRHSHISLLAEMNVPLKAIMERVGHADSDTTLSIYNHVTRNARANLLINLNKL